jgi:phosphotransferase system enzyme I (PtsI)
MKLKDQEIYLYGQPICRGIAVGKPFMFAFVDDDIPDFPIAPADLGKEIQRYKNAVECVEEDLCKLRKQLEDEQVLEGSEILETHQQIIKDPILTADVENQIRLMSKNAEFVFSSVVKQYQKKFSSLTDPFFRERFKDLQDISRRILNYLLKSVNFSLVDIPRHAIIFARDFTPSDVVEAKRAEAKALVSLLGGATSHAAIVAKANGIPFIANIDFENIKFKPDTSVIVDGRLGFVIINPTPETLSDYEHQGKELHARSDYLERIGQLPAETYDGYTIRVSANIDVLNEADILHQYGGSGVGLFRSEYLFFTNEKFPEEEEQFEIYKGIVEKMRGLPIVIRTFDVGINQCLAKEKAIQEDNPYLGCRAIRLSLREKNVFKVQLRAIIRASLYGEVSVMFPMISSLTELKEAKKILGEAKAEVEATHGKKFKPLRVGSMIEVPSAAIISDLLAKECHFLSIGTNDLVQYALAVDRDNHMMTSLYSPTHPGVIRLIKLVVHEANRYGIPVTICGEMASDPRFTALLLALGVNELSVAARYIPIVKNAIRNTGILAAVQLLNEVMKLTLADEIEELLTREYKRSVPEDCYV